ncbi:MAG: DUF4287 domain-containing protein [Phycisphaerales bacterium]|nr:DUF4287 domain-containing protein [Phycisphaerales bacterium]
MARSLPEYDVHPSVRTMADWIDGLKAKTGRSLEEWLTHIRGEGPEGEPEVRAWLKREHGLGTNAAWWLAERSAGKGGQEDTPEGYLRAARDYVETMYEKKEMLRPIHDAIIKAARDLGGDVRVCPCQTIVPLYRAHVFAQIKPSTRTRLDMGLCLTPLVKQNKTIPDRLVDTGGFAKKDRITHRIGLCSIEDFDRDARGWLRRAYELDG